MSKKIDTSDIAELDDDFWDHSISSRVRKRLCRGEFRSGDDVTALRKFARMTQEEFARAMRISVHTLRNWEQGSRHPEGPAIALLSIIARHPQLLHENLAASAA